MLPENVISRIRISPDGCHNWLGAHASNGYSECGIGGKIRSVHRIVYEDVYGPIPDGLEIDHLCRNRGCVNPVHLEAVAHSVNVKRGIGPAMIAAMKRSLTHCKRGHPFDKQNTRIAPNGQRRCRECLRLWMRANRKGISIETLLQQEARVEVDR